jgi:hypothetical protein
VLRVAVRPEFQSLKLQRGCRTNKHTLIIGAVLIPDGAEVKTFRTIPRASTNAVGDAENRSDAASPLPAHEPRNYHFERNSVPGSIDGMLKQVAKNQDLTIPLSDLAFSDPCR